MCVIAWFGNSSISKKEQTTEAALKTPARVKNALLGQFATLPPSPTPSSMCSGAGLSVATRLANWPKIIVFSMHWSFATASTAV